MKIGLASDHAGFKLKTEIIKHLEKLGYKDIKDYGTYNEESSDYPDYAHPLGKSVNKNENDIGFSICGSGNGINMVVNKYKNVRSALCWNNEICKLAREHNNANVCALPARFLSDEDALMIVDTFLNTKFEGGRHQRRIDKI